jgi:hypothetical protein
MRTKGIASENLPIKRPNEGNESFRLLVVANAIDNFREGDILADISDLDSDTLALFGVGNNDDEPALNSGDSIALIANIFDFDGALLSFLDGGRL